MSDRAKPCPLTAYTISDPGNDTVTTLADTTGVIISALGSYALLEGPAAGTDSDIVVDGSAWSATRNASWLHTSASGTGDGLAIFTFDANTGPTRSGTLTIAGQTLTVTQAGSSYLPANLITLVSAGISHPAGVAVDGAGKTNTSRIPLTTRLRSGMPRRGHSQPWFPRDWLPRLVWGWTRR